jgi:hypothetical protein
VAVGVAVRVAVGEAVLVLVGLGVNEGSRQIGVESLEPSGSRVLPCSSYSFTLVTCGSRLRLLIKGCSRVYTVPFDWHEPVR